eukprot:SAG11_NODE_11056_length_786_cov_1.950509_1_plen_231_part_10
MLGKLHVHALFGVAVLAVAVAESLSAQQDTVSTAAEVVVFATGYNGPIDNGDDWHYFDWSRATTVVSMGGRVPSGLVAAAAKAGRTVLKGVVLDTDAANATAVRLWATAVAAAVTASGAGGVNVVRVTQPAGTGKADVTAALSMLKQALARTSRSHRQVTATLALSGPMPSYIDRAAVFGVCDYVVLACFDGDIGGTAAAPNCGLPELQDSLKQLAASEKQKTVVALPWYG